MESKKKCGSFGLAYCYRPMQIVDMHHSRRTIFVILGLAHYPKLYYDRNVTKYLEAVCAGCRIQRIMAIFRGDSMITQRTANLNRQCTGTTQIVEVWNRGVVESNTSKRLCGINK